MEPTTPLPPPLPPAPPPSAPLAAPARRPRPPRRPPRSGLRRALRNNIVVVVVATVVLGVAGTALALGQPSRPTLDLTSAPVVADPTPPTSGPASPAPAPGAGSSDGSAAVVPSTPAKAGTAPRVVGGLGGHGVATVSTSRGSVSVTFDRGTVEGLTYGAITVAHPDGSTATLVITAATKFRPAGRYPRVGDRVIVYSAGRPALVVMTR